MVYAALYKIVTFYITCHSSDWMSVISLVKEN